MGNPMNDELLDALTDAMVDIDPAVTWVSDGDRTLVFGDGSVLIMPAQHMPTWNASETK